MTANVNWDLCGICKLPLGDRKGRKPMKGGLRYVHGDCLERVQKYIADNWESLPDPTTFTK